MEFVFGEPGRSKVPPCLAAFDVVLGHALRDHGRFPALSTVVVGVADKGPGVSVARSFRRIRESQSILKPIPDFADGLDEAGVGRVGLD
ncbi:MAG: hypothetical protein AAF492_21595, partial [Verrucomicrobiota bacterium]